MWKLLFLTLFMPFQAFATPSECPLYANKQDCLQSVENNYKTYLDFLDEEYNSPKDELIEAANSIRHFESLACQKTCLN